MQFYTMQHLVTHCAGPTCRRVRKTRFSPLNNTFKETLKVCFNEPPNQGATNEKFLSSGT
jgi:hypothetical protein